MTLSSRTPGSPASAAAPEPIRVAGVYDDVDRDGTPYFDPDRRRFPAAEGAAVADLLESGAVLLATTARLDDVLDSVGGRARIPLVYRTDGVWVWNDAASYYARVHGVEPDGELLAHLRRYGAAGIPQPDRDAVMRAIAALTGPE